MKARKETYKQFVNWKIVKRTVRGYEPSFHLYVRASFLGIHFWMLKLWSDNPDMLEQWAADFDKRARDFDEVKP